MSRIGAIAQELQESDDSFDGRGWIGEVIPRKYFESKPQPIEEPAEQEETTA